VALTAAVAGAALLQVLVVRPAPATSVLQVRSVSATPSQDGSIDVAVQVTNPRSSPVTARIWWLLATPGPGGEWERRAYQSAVRALIVSPESSVNLNWTEAALVPKGDYVLSAWAHVPGPEGFVHASGKVADSKVGIGSGALLRAGPPRFDMSITGVVANRDTSDSSHLDATVSLLNAADSPRRAHVQVALGPVAGAGDPAWWRAAPAWTTDEVTVEIAAGSRAVVPVKGRAVVPPGQYIVRASLVDAAPNIEGPIDEVAVADSLRAIGTAS
jgi:hypothetical protein